MKLIPIDIDTFKGTIPRHHDLVVYEKNDPNPDRDALVLYGFDEVGQFDDEFDEPAYGFLQL